MTDTARFTVPLKERLTSETVTVRFGEDLLAACVPDSLHSMPVTVVVLTGTGS